MEIYDLIADYPDRQKEGFYESLIRKKEFSELAVSDDEGTMGKWMYYSHQRIIARFLSHWTLYNSLLLFHDTGTGKSGSAVSVFETLRQHNHELQTVYVTQNETQIDNFKSELFRLSHYLWNLLHVAGNEHHQTAADMEMAIHRKLQNRILRQENFSFFTYTTLASTLKKTETLFADQHVLLIFDEAHHLVTQDVEKPKSTYAILYQWVQQITKKRLLVMTATPMRNDVSEIVPLLNLILPPEASFPFGKTFEEDYFDSTPTSSGIPMLTWKPLKEEEFQSRIQGYVSVVRQHFDIRIDYEGRVIAPMTQYNLVPHVMQSFQSEHYRRAFQADRRSSRSGTTTITETSFYSRSSQASLFVYPDGSSGEQGMKHYVSAHGHGFYPRLFQECGLSKANTPETNLEHLSRYSITYARIIQEILDNPNDHIFIYCDKLNGSGILVLFTLLTKIFLYKALTMRNVLEWDWTDYHPRCMLLNEVQEFVDVREYQFQSMINIFNDERNRDADFVQVVFGTDKTKEGISLKRIRQIHITTPDWNFGKITQAIGRGIRLTSHIDLPPVDRKVTIFLHAAFPLVEGSVSTSSESHINPSQCETSIDFYRYWRSELRDRNIKLVEYALLVSAFDCQLNKRLNDYTDAKDGSPACYYKACRYICRGVGVEALQASDTSSFDSFYLFENIRGCTEAIISLFENDCVLDFEDIVYALQRRVPTTTRREVMEGLVVITNTPVRIYYRGIQPMWLTSEGDTFFLIDDLRLLSFPAPTSLGEHSTSIRTWPSSLWYYGVYPSFDLAIAFPAMVLQISRRFVYIQRILETLHRLVNYPGDFRVHYRYHLLRLLQSIPIDILETFVLKVMAQFHQDMSGVLVEFIVNEFLKTQWVVDASGRTIHTLYGPSRPRIYDRTTKTWRDVDTRDETSTTDAVTFVTTEDTSLPADMIRMTDHTAPAFRKRYIDENKYGIYGYVAKSVLHPTFKIRDIRRTRDNPSLTAVSKKDKKYETIGKDCSSYKSYELLHFLFRLGLRFPISEADVPSADLRVKWTDLQTWTLDRLQNVITPLPLWKAFVEECKDLVETTTERERLSFVAYYKYLRKEDYCQLLQQLLKEKLLLVDPPIIKTTKN